MPERRGNAGDAAVGAARQPRATQAPYSDQWERKPLDWAMERIAERVKQTRDETFVERLPRRTVVNHTIGIGSLGGATLDNEENYLIKKLFGGGLGMVNIENQARI